MTRITKLLALFLLLILVGCDDSTLISENNATTEVGDAAYDAASKNGKLSVCHYSNDGVYHSISVGESALSAHRAHGDAVPGEPYPGVFGKKFGTDCSAVDANPDFVPFKIRNANVNGIPGTITEPWDSDLVIEENVEGDGFSAKTPRGGQKVGYGTKFFDGLPINSIESAYWDRISGLANIVAYLNIWVTDGNGNFAIIASENDYRGQDFSTRREWKIFEFGPTADLNWLFADGGGSTANRYLLHHGVKTTLAELGNNIVIGDPGSYPSPAVSTGAPRGGFGFNLIFGDTQSNFVGSYHLENLTVTRSGVTYEASNP